MIKHKKRFLSLNLKIVLVTLLALVIAAGSFFATYSVSNHFLKTYYMSSENVSARKAKLYLEFSKFVKASQVSGTDTRMISNWCRGHRYVEIHVYRSQQSAGKSFLLDSSAPDVPSAEQYSHEYGKLYPMSFYDGSYQIAIVDSSENRELLINGIISVLVGTVLFIIIMILYSAGLTNRIIALSRQAYIVSEGDLDAPLSNGIGDELNALSIEMDNLRNSVIDRMTSEHKAWAANNELITAISHDIRTPMTGLIGYLELLNEGGFEDPDKCAVFTRSAYNKALELKDLTDELFKYFLVFGRSDPKLDNDTFDASMLIGQLLSETAFELEDLGFTAELQLSDDVCSVYLDPLYLKRVMDNLCSNIKKYADKANPVVFVSGMKDGKYVFSVTNAIACDINRVESNKIGLRTCVRILELMHGEFKAVKSPDGLSFTAEITLPVVNI